MKIKLIAPTRKPEWGESFWDLKTLAKLTGRKAGGAPLALPTLAALTPPDVELVLTDENVEPINFEEKVDLVGITGMTCVVPRSYEIADEYRKRGVPVVMGGVHVSMLPEEAIQHCDSGIIGEAEEIWKQVVRDAEKKKLEKFYRLVRFPDLANSPMPRWDLLNHESYPILPLQIGRGCPYDCDFCTVQKFNGRQYRYKTLERVIEEIKYLIKLAPKKPLFFIDDNILSLKNYAKELFQKLIPFNIKWWCQASIGGLNNDEDILELMYKAGCREIFIGFESVFQDSLSSMGKSIVNETGEYKKIINRIYSHKIAVFGSFIIGSDNDTQNIFNDTFKFIEDTNIAFSMINILTPVPGTVLYQRLTTENRVVSKDWWRFNGEYVCFKPQLMLQGELQHKRDRLLFDIFSYENISKRLENLWRQNIHIRKTANSKKINKIKLYLTFKALLLGNIFNKKKIVFIIRFLWLLKSVSIFAIIMALNFNDYASSCVKKNKLLD